MGEFLIYAAIMINVIVILAELMQSMLEQMDETLDITRGISMSPVAEGPE